MPVGPALKWVRIRKEVFVTSVGSGNTLDPMNPPLPGYQPPSPRTYVVAADPSLRVQILDIGLACCSLEVGSAITTGLLVDSATVPSPDHGTTILLISGTVTDALAPAVLRAWEQLPNPKRRSRSVPVPIPVVHIGTPRVSQRGWISWYRFRYISPVARRGPRH